MNTSIFGLSPQPRYRKSVDPNAFLTITPLGGLGQIGMNCMVWSTQNTKVLIDCGLMFPSEYHLGVDIIIPQFEHIKANKELFKGIVLTHGHEDHIGALPWLVPHLNVPIYGSTFTLALVEHKLRERGLLDRCTLVEVGAKNPLQIGDLTFHFFPVSHSIIDGLALGVETPAGKVVHTGDFKLDKDPIDGVATDLNAFANFAGPEGVDLLLSDSTNVEREGHTLNEKEVLAGLSHIFKKATGRIVVTLFSSNIQRIQEVFTCAQECGRSVFVSGRSLKNNIEMAKNLGRLAPPDSLHFDDSPFPPVPHEKQVLLVTGSQGEPMSALSRIVLGTHRHLTLREGDVVIMSSRLIPGNAMAVNTMVNNIYRSGADVYFDKEFPVHASGHAQQDELVSMLQSTRPKYFVPIHGEYRHLVKHRRLALANGVLEENAHVIENGQPFTLTPNAFILEEPVSAAQVMIDGKGVGDVGQAVLRERHLLGGEGLVVVVLVLDESTWSILHGPEIFSKGFVFEQHYSHVLEDAKCLVLDAIEGYPTGDADKLAERIRSSLRRFFRKVLERDPIVVPVITAV